METFMQLARLYGADSPTALLFPPQDHAVVAAFEAAFRVLRHLPPEDREHWLSMGQRIAALVAKPEPEGGGGEGGNAPNTAPATA